MGNRAVISFSNDAGSKESLGVYLHWNGGPESVLAFLDAAKELGIRGGVDSPYFFARFVQMVGNFFGGTSSVGVDVLAKSDCDNRDNGLYVLNEDLSIKERLYAKPGAPLRFEDLDEEQKARYLEIKAAVLHKNAEIFKEG